MFTRNIFKPKTSNDYTSITTQNFRDGVQIQVTAQTVDKACTVYQWIKEHEAKNP